MRAEPRDRLVDVDMGGVCGDRRCAGGGALGKGLVRQGRRAEPPIQRPGGDRQQQDRDNRRRARLRAGAGFGLDRLQCEDAAGDLGARRFGLLGGQDAARQIALDLGQLVAVDGEVVGLARGGAAPAKKQRRQQHREGERGQPTERGGEPDAHRSVPSPRTAARRRRSSALSGAAAVSSLRR